MKKHVLSRRHLLAGAAGAAALATLPRPAQAQTAEKSALLVIHLSGGYNALFCSPDSFAPAGTFGVTSSNIKSLGNGLFVDAATYGVNLPASAQAAMATIGLRHGLSSHDPARVAEWSDGTRSYALQLAAAMGGAAAIKCAVVGSNQPLGPKPAEGNVSMQVITDLSSTIAALGGGSTSTIVPDRAKAAAALTSARTMSAADLAASAKSLVSVKNAYDSSIAVLQQGSQAFNYATIAAAYGVGSTTTAVTSFTTKMLAAELMVLAGANVIIAVDSFSWDSHGDTTGSAVRTRMNSVILPGLKVFVERMMAATGRNVTTAILGDFARSLPGSDHANAVSATVMGKRVKVGTTGRVSSSVTLPSGSPSSLGFWSYLADLARSPTNPFGADPHAALVLP